ncbi:MAG: hypothetical protein IPL79_19880 [Myxococcales bacterium]|nr:hypothetical protein [Myxococcales bacterium]
MGAAVGAGLGGALGGTVGGWFGKKKKNIAPTPRERAYMGGNALAEQRYLSELGGGEYAAFQAAEEAQRQANEARGLENQVFGEFGALDQQYADLAAGRGPSVGRQMAMQGADVAQQQANQMAASARGGGGNQLLAQRMAQQTGAQAQQQASAEAARIGAQEQLAAMGARAGIAGQRAGLAGQMRSGDYQGRAYDEARGGRYLDARTGAMGQIYQGQTGAAAGNQEASMLAQVKNAELAEAERARRQRLIENAAAGAAGAAKGGAT